MRRGKERDRQEVEKRKCTLVCQKERPVLQDCTRRCMCHGAVTHQAHHAQCSDLLSSADTSCCDLTYSVSASLTWDGIRRDDFLWGWT